MSKSEQRKPANEPKRALGKGLQSLLPSRSAPVGPPLAQPVAVVAPALENSGGVAKVAHARVKPNPNQPRRDFDQQALMELAVSIERDGIIQPIVVRSVGSEFQIIAGERRWRAASLAGLKEVPVIVKEANDQKVLELAIVENIQREDLNPIELAQAFERMASELSLSHEEIGQKTGKDRATVTNSIRLLQLPRALQEMVGSRKLSAGHARALLKVTPEKKQQEIAERCINEGWSVRQIEEITKPEKEPGDEIVAKKPDHKPVDPNVRAAIVQLEKTLGTRVKIMSKKGGKGSIEIEYYSEEDLDRIYTMIVGESDHDPALL